MFKCFKFIDDMMKQLNEADEMPMENDAEMGGDEAAAENPAAEGDMEMEGGEAPAEDGVTLMKILCAIYKSAETGHEVTID